MTDLARLVVRLEGENAKLVSSLDVATRQLRRFKTDSDSVLREIRTKFRTLLGGITLAVVTKQLKDVVDKADDMTKLSQSTGVAVENLTALDYATRLGGVSTEQLGTAFKRLSVNMSDTIRGTGEAKEAFGALGLTVDDLRNNSPDQVIKLIADRFAGFEDGANKSAIAIKIFGRAGAELIPTLNQGSRGIEQFEARARALGITFDAQTGQSFEAFNDSITELQAAFQGFKIAVATDMVPALTRITTAFTEAKVAGTGFQGFMQSFRAQGGGGPFSDPSQVFSIKALEEQLKTLRREYETTEAKIRKGLHFDPDTASLEIPAANQTYLEVLEKQILAIEIRLRDLNRIGQQEITQLGKQLQTLNNYWQIGAISTQQYIDAVRKAANVKIPAPEITTVNNKAIIEQFNILEQNKTSVEKLGDEILRLNAYWQGGLITVEQYSEAVRRAAKVPDFQAPQDTFSRPSAQLSDLANALTPALEQLDLVYEKRRALVEANLTDEEERNRVLVSIDARYASERIALEQSTQDQLTAIRSGALQDAADLFGLLAGKSRAAALAQIAITKGLAIAQTLAHTQTAAVLAYASQLIPGDPSSYARAAAAYTSTQSLGRISAALIAAQGLAQGLAAAKGGSSSGAGSSGAQGVVQVDAGTGLPTQAQAARPTVQVYFGDLYGFDDYMRDKLLATIKSAVNQNDEVFINFNSRQAREIRGAA